MNNPETQVTLGTRHRTKTNKAHHTTQKTKKKINTDPTIKPEQFQLTKRYKEAKSTPQRQIQDF